ncbi:core-binding factor subunit beta-like isoform X1 [Paramuricea clavata]|uniref:Core-binding factor subunit beta-like isoform X1 n=1 Tax=Paramuricea clavata TaxID=317549 RepID=A0A7D9DIJ5_PARCT|nr:core-binding factor subunit beta-like isoform X1 [Paramuricea clavata]
MPRVVENQRAKFETDPVLRQLQEDSEIRYIDHCDCSLEERRVRFRTECHEGSSKIGFIGNGVHLLLSFPKVAGSRYTSSEFVDFSCEMGKVYIQCPLIFNGVCVKFFGCLVLQTLAGIGHLEFDETQAQVEHDLRVETLKNLSAPE